MALTPQKISDRDRLTGTGAVKLPAVLAGSTTDFAIQNNYEATTNPGVGDDDADGYSIGSLWLNKTTGQQWVAVNVATGAAVWSLMNSIGIVAFNVSSNTAYAGPAEGASAQDAQSANVLYMSTIVLPFRRTITKLAIARGAAVSGNARVGLYTIGASGMPDKLIVDGGAISTNATGIVEATVSVDLPAGRYYGAVLFSAAANVSRNAGTTQTLGWMDSGTGVAPFNGLTRSMTYGALNSDESASTWSSKTDTPWVGIR